jgi:hypothetical protein
VRGGILVLRANLVRGGILVVRADHTIELVDSGRDACRSSLVSRGGTVALDNRSAVADRARLPGPTGALGRHRASPRRGIDLAAGNAPLASRP